MSVYQDDGSFDPSYRARLARVRPDYVLWEGDAYTLCVCCSLPLADRLQRRRGLHPQCETMHAASTRGEIKSKVVEAEIDAEMRAFVARNLEAAAARLAPPVEPPPKNKRGRKPAKSTSTL